MLLLKKRGVPVIPRHEVVSDKHYSQGFHCKSNRERPVILYTLYSK